MVWERLERTIPNRKNLVCRYPDGNVDMSSQVSLLDPSIFDGSVLCMQVLVSKEKSLGVLQGVDSIRLFEIDIYLIVLNRNLPSGVL